jgi:hypothetical protein
MLPDPADVPGTSSDTPPAITVFMLSEGSGAWSNTQLEIAEAKAAPEKRHTAIPPCRSLSCAFALPGKPVQDKRLTSYSNIFSGFPGHVVGAQRPRGGRIYLWLPPAYGAASHSYPNPRRAPPDWSDTRPARPPEWILDLKRDGFPAIACVERGAWLVSRDNHIFRISTGAATASARRSSA